LPKIPKPVIISLHLEVKVELEFVQFVFWVVGFTIADFITMSLLLFAGVMIYANDGFE
jgi:hypothetical protein